MMAASQTGDKIVQDVWLMVYMVRYIRLTLRMTAVLKTLALLTT